MPSIYKIYRVAVFLFITFKDRILRFVEFDNGGWHFVILYEFQNLLKDNIKPLATHLNFTFRYGYVSSLNKTSFCNNLPVVYTNSLKIKINKNIYILTRFQFNLYLLLTTRNICVPQFMINVIAFLLQHHDITEILLKVALSTIIPHNPSQAVATILPLSFLIRYLYPN
jgi:hypothetical protein